MKKVFETIKKILQIAVVVIVCVVVLDFFAGLFSSKTGIKSITMRMNDRAAQRVADYIANLPMPEHSEVAEKIALAGNIDSSGRVTLYYGAVLIKSDLSLEELKEYFGQYDYDGYYLDIQEQEVQELPEVKAASVLDRDYLLTDVSEDNYFLIGSYGSGIGIFGLLYDPRCED